MKRKYNYQVIFKGQLSEGSSRFMTEEMARTYALHIMTHSKLNDMVIQVKRLTPEVMPFTWSNSTADTGITFTTDFTQSNN